MSESKTAAEEPRNLATSVAARPLLARWLFEQRSTMAEAARRLGVSREMVRLYCLPFGHGLRCKPSAATREAIAALTADAVPPWTFDDTPAARAAFFDPPAVSVRSAAGRRP